MEQQHAEDELLALRQRLAELERDNDLLRKGARRRASTRGSGEVKISTGEEEDHDDQDAMFAAVDRESESTSTQGAAAAAAAASAAAAARSRPQDGKRLTAGPAARHKRASMSAAGNRMSLPSAHSADRGSGARRFAGISPGSPTYMLPLQTLTPALTRSEETRVFIEFAEIGVQRRIMHGEAPPELWCQATERLSQYPAGVPPAAAAGSSSTGSTSPPPPVGFVQQLEDFCFPRGAALSVARAPEDSSAAAAQHATTAASAALYGPHLDTLHLLRFTDGLGHSTYGACVTVTERVARPCSKLIRYLLVHKDLKAKAARVVLVSADCDYHD
jgi:uDENN domain